MISVTCGGCGKGYKVPDEAAGKRTKCKQCGTAITIPGVRPGARSASVAPPPPVPVAPIPVAPLSEADFGGDEIFQPAPYSPPPMPRRRTGPVAKAPVKSGFSLGFKIDGLSIILTVLGIAALAYGISESRLAGLASETPQRITCQALVDNGPGSNIHVQMTDFAALSYWVGKKEQNSSKWKEVYLPLIPMSAVPRGIQADMKKKGTKFIKYTDFDSSKVHLLLKTTTCPDEASLTALINQGYIQGMIVNQVESMSREEKDLLSQSYPIMNVGDAYILEEGRKPQGGVGQLMLGLGVVLLIGAVANTLRPR